MIEKLKALFKKKFKIVALNVEQLPKSGSYRQYYRLSNDNVSAIGVFNEDGVENKAFIEFCKHFFMKGVNVPEIYEEDLVNNIYLQEDLGEKCLLDYLEGDNKAFPFDIIELYKKVVSSLIDMQIKGGKGLDYSLCVPRDTFDRQSISWDLNYYKYCWCRLAKIPLDEQKLEDDFQVLINYLLLEDREYFLFRDFQCRNIMIKDGEPFFIDFQGGRKGALQYDIASLLYDAIAEMPANVREDLLDYYMDCAEKYIHIDRFDFRKKFYAFALVRLLQAMGAFGLRGLHENKQHFIDSIEPGIKKLSGLVMNLKEYLDLPEIYKTINNYRK